MSVKTIEIEGIGPVTVYKRKGSRSIRVSVSHKGEARITMPTWAPQQAAVDFALSKKDWILQQLPARHLLGEGYRLGRAHHLTYVRTDGTDVSTRISGTEARVLLPAGIRWDSYEAQLAAESVGIRTLKKEAKMILPPRLKYLAEQHGFTYRDVSIKQLTGRWGSCSSEKDITLNCFLMQLPLELIDYVLLHELTHTNVMAHGPVFWDEMRRVLPEVDVRRAAIKSHKPVL